MLINRETGRPPTETELKRIKERAQEIARSPYSSPEQLEWALMVDPEGFADVLVEPYKRTRRC